jgi:hypothetical protein
MSTACRHLRAAEHFIDWTHRHGMPVRRWNAQSLAGFDRHLSRCRHPHCGYRMRLNVIHGARVFLTYLRDARVITLPSVEPHDQEPALLSAFYQWMRQQRGACEATLQNYSVHMRELLRRLGEDSTRFDARRLRAFVLEKSGSCGWGTAKNCTTALRTVVPVLHPASLIAISSSSTPSIRNFTSSPAPSKPTSNAPRKTTSAPSPNSSVCTAAERLLNRRASDWRPFADATRGSGSVAPQHAHGEGVRAACAES